MKKDTLVFTNDLGYGKDKGSFEYKSFVQPSVISEVIQSGLDPVDADNEEAVKNTVDNLLNELDVTINSKGFNDAENNQKELLVGNAASTSTLRKQTFDVFKLEKKYNTDMALILPLSIAAAKVVQKAYAEGKDIFKGLSADIDLFTALPITQLGTRDTSEKIKSAYAERFTTDNHVVQINTFNKTISVTLTFNNVYVLKEGEIATVLAIKYGPDELKQAIMEDVKKNNPTRIDDAKNLIENKKAVLGIELGSTRIKAVLIDEENNPIASGNFDWENSFENGIWTYSLDEIHKGLSGAYASLKANVKLQYGVTLKGFAAIGISGMMHGYMPFNENGTLLTPFRTWRNTITEDAANELSLAFDFNIPQRWSIAHFYSALKNGEKHTKDVRFFTTLAGYIHFLLTGEKVLGVGEASGMFPIDEKTHKFDEEKIDIFNSLAKKHGFCGNVKDLLPDVLSAGENAGYLTKEGALLLDKDGDLKAGVPLCPPEGDAGTGMVATNSVRIRTGNVSAGTSVFLMIVLEKALSKM